MDQLNNPIYNNNNSSNNISPHALPNIHVALRILPLASEDQSQNIIKISENGALLTTPSKSYMYEFDHIITEPPNYLYDSLPHAIINDLLSGQNSTLFTHDSTQLQNGIDLRMLSSLSYRLFTLKDSDSTINVQYIELAENNTTFRDLLSHDVHYLPMNQSIPKRPMNQVQDIENFYKLGSEKRKPHCVSIFSLTLVESAKIATFYNVDISGVDDAIRDVVTHHWLHHINQKHLQIREKDSLYNLFIRSKNIYFVTSIQPNHERQAENIIHHASTIYNMAKGRDPQHMKEQAIQRFEQWMIKISNNNSSENISQQQRGSINTTTITSSSSSSEYDRHRHASMFSSISNSTSLTVPESITEEKDHLILADLYRQIEELQNQVTVTRERNRHVEKELQEFRSLSSLDVRSIDDMDRLLMVEEKQSLLINGLESKLEQTEGLVQNLQQQLDLLDKEKYMLEENVEKQVKWIMEEVESLRFKKDEIQCLSSVMDQRLDHQEYMNKQNMEEIAQLRTRYQSQEKENVKKNHFIESVACQLLTSTTSTHDDMSVYAINENRFEELNKCIKELVVQRNRYSQQLKESRDEHEKLQHTFTMRCAKAGLIEKKSQHLTKELDSVRQLLRDQDTSGMIRKLENKITTLELEKEDIQADFEHSYESALNELKYVQKKADDHFHTIQSLERTTMGLHEQLTHSSSALIQKDQEMRILLESNQRLLKINDQLKYQNNDRVCRSRSSAPVKKPSFMETQIQWYKQKTEGSFGKIQVADRLLQMSEENHRLKVYIDELETKVMRVRQDSAREIQSLESEIYLLGEDGSRLLQHLPRPPLRHERKISIPPSPSSDFSRHASYLTSAPPTDPLPPVPTTPEPSERSCRNKIHMLEGDIRIHQQVISKLETQLLASETTVQEQRGQLMKETNLKTELALISDELHRERERTLKAERQCQILQKRIDHGMNKKNKFRCF